MSEKYMERIDINVITGEQTVITIPDAEAAAIVARASQIEADEALPKLRKQRDQLLRESDTVILPDRWAAMSAQTQTAWASYRQSLRDLPANTTDPLNPIWPVKPGA
jgi:hypothetical protein